MSIGKKIAFSLITTILIYHISFGQKENKNIALGNQAYQKGKYKEASDYYSKALKINPKSYTAKYNLANAQLRLKNVTAAQKNYQSVAKKGNAALQEKAYYNQGVAEAKNQKLKEAIASFKNALRRQPGDNDARENLQKAINELKKQQNNKNNKNNKKDNKNQNKPQNNKNNQQNKKNDQQSPQQKQQEKQMDQLLNQLREQEKDLQKKLQRGAGNPRSKNGKDW